MNKNTILLVGDGSAMVEGEAMLAWLKDYSPADYDDIVTICGDDRLPLWNDEFESQEMYELIWSYVRFAVREDGIWFGAHPEDMNVLGWWAETFAPLYQDLDLSTAMYTTDSVLASLGFTVPSR